MSNPAVKTHQCGMNPMTGAIECRQDGAAAAAAQPTAHKHAAAKLTPSNPAVKTHKCGMNPMTGSIECRQDAASAAAQISSDTPITAEYLSQFASEDNSLF